MFGSRLLHQGEKVAAFSLQYLASLLAARRKPVALSPKGRRGEARAAARKKTKETARFSVHFGVHLLGFGEAESKGGQGMREMREVTIPGATTQPARATVSTGSPAPTNGSASINLPQGHEINYGIITSGACSTPQEQARFDTQVAGKPPQ